MKPMQLPDKEVSRLRLLLKLVSFLEHLTLDQLDHLIDEIDKKSFARGEVLVKQGERGDKFYILASGTVDVYQRRMLMKRHIRTMGSGAFFGELALIQDSPRTATVIGGEPGDYYFLTRHAFDQILLKNPTIGDTIRKAAAGRLRDDKARNQQ